MRKIVIIALLLELIGLKGTGTAQTSRGDLGQSKDSFYRREKSYIAERYRDLEVEKKCGKPCRKRLYKISADRIDYILRYLQKKFDYQFRIRAISSMLLGAPYKLGPLGEGEKGKFDKDPIFRLDRFDCVTYVETVIALAHSRSLREAVKILQKIRYSGGKISYFTRNHFTAGQWLPNNEKAGIIAPLMNNWPEKFKVEINRNFSPKYWFSTPWGKKIPPIYLPNKLSVSYVRLKDISKIIPYLPAVGWMGEVKSGSGAVVFQHVGFFVKKYGRFYFRDANYYPGVSDHRLLEYAARRRRQRPTERRPYKIIGFSFFRFSEPKGGK